MTAAPRRDGPLGFVLVSALILLTIVAMLGLTFSRHVVVERKSTATARAITEAQESTLTALDFARQALQTAATGSSESGVEGLAEGFLGDDGLLGSGDLTSSMKESHWAEIETVDTTRTRLWARALDAHGLGSTRLLECTWMPSASADHPDTLPRIEPSLAAAVAADMSVTKHAYTSNTTLRDVEITGVLVVHDNVTLTLAGDVVVRGTIVSADALGAADFGDFVNSAAPKLKLKGTVRIESQPFLPSVAIVMPDGKLVTASGSGNVLIEGDVVAHKLEIERAGLLDGSVYSVSDPVLDAGLDQIGAGRGPRAPSPSLELRGPRRTAVLAVVPRVTIAADYQAILDYDFP